MRQPGIHILQIILVNYHNLFNRYSGSKLNLYDIHLSVIEAFYQRLVGNYFSTALYFHSSTQILKGTKEMQMAGKKFC